MSRLERTLLDRGARQPAAPGHGLLRVLAWALIALAIIYLVFAGGGFAGIYSVRIRIISLAILAVTLVVWLVWAWRHPAWRPSTAIWPAFVVSLAVMAFATAISPTPRFGIEYVAWAILLTGGYLLLVRLWADPFFRPRLGALTVSAAFALCLLYIAVVVGRWIDWWGIVGSIVVPPLRPGFEGLSYGNPSAVLTVAVLLVTAAVAHLGFATVGRRIAVAILLVLAGVVIVMTGSRAGWFAVPVAIVVTAVGWLLVPEHRASIRRRMTGRAVWVGVGVVAVVGFAAFAVLLPVILVRLGSGGEEGRLTFMATAFRMFLSAPIAGFGPGGWAPRRIAFTEPGEIDYYVPHAHDVYLATAAEYGVIGLAAGAVAVACVLWLIVRAVRDPDPVRRRFGWASLFGLVYFGAHQLLDFYPNMPAALFAFALPIAFLDATAGRSVTANLVQLGPRLVNAARVGLFVAVLAAVATLGMVRVDRPARIERRRLGRP